MNRLCWRIISVLSRLLENDDRTAVLGDFVESKDGALRALAEVLGLALRRQLELWKSYQPWIALLGVAGAAGYFLSELTLKLDFGLFQQVRTYLKYGVRYEFGVSAVQDGAALGSLLLGLVIWSWAGGFVLGSLSGRAAWFTGSAFYIAVAASSTLHHILITDVVAGARLPIPLVFLRLILPATPGRVCFVLAAGLGTLAGCRRRALPFGKALLWCAIGTVLIATLLWTGGWYEAAKETLSNGTWQATPWTERIVPFLIMSWPLAYLVGTSWYGGRKSAHYERA